MPQKIQVTCGRVTAGLGFNEAFAHYMAEHLRKFARGRTERDRNWLTESAGQPVGGIAIVRLGPSLPQHGFPTGQSAPERELRDGGD